MHAYPKNIPAKFHPDPIWNDGAISEEGAQQEQEKQQEQDE